MTAASHTSRAFAASGRTSVRWQRALALLGICLPVPICAASGLTLPLPATIERIAASLVPWADARAMSANEALRAGARGTILADPDERSEHRVEPSRVALSAPLLGGTTGNPRIVIPRPGDPYAWPGSGDEPVPASPVPAAPVDGTVGVEAVGDPTSAPQKSSEDAAPVPPPATTPKPADDPDPVPVPVPEPIVDEVLAPTEPLVEETRETLEETIEPVTGILPGLGK
jgi:hypothetical protein